MTTNATLYYVSTNVTKADLAPIKENVKLIFLLVYNMLIVIIVERLLRDIYLISKVIVDFWFEQPVRFWLFRDFMH